MFYYAKYENIMQKFLFKTSDLLISVQWFPVKICVCAITLQKIEVYASKFAISYIGIRNLPKVAFSVFILCYFTFSPNECPGLC